MTVNKNNSKNSMNILYEGNRNEYSFKKIPDSLKFLPPIVLLTLSILTKSLVEEWLFMWIFGFSIFFCCKWITLVDALNNSPNVSKLRAVLYMFGWVGMDAKRFLTDNKLLEVQNKVWLETISKILIGLFLMYVITEKVYSINHLLGGWIGLAGFGIFMHFGLFHLIALIWNKFGVNVKPVINSPLYSTSLTDFWSNRWNLAFRDLSRNYILRPLAPKIGIVYATIIVFLISGLIHELIISFPANGGYGLPTLYFIIQITGLFVEKSKIGKKLGLMNALRGRIFAFLVIFGPFSLLFHKAFIEKIMLPFLYQIKGL